VRGGTEGSALMTREVELTENKADTKTKYKLLFTIDKEHN
tara:strand:- start:166 stop:285 length:120 start_codon:yes stop_codon:yes gene_type:complete